MTTSAATIQRAVPVRRRRVMNVFLWVLQVALAGAFISAGANKLGGDPLMVQAFDQIGFGQWFRYLTGGLEVVGGVLLLVPALAGVGALLMAGVMVGAVLTHLVLIGGSATAAFVLLVASVVVVAGRRERTLEVLRRLRPDS